MAGGVKEDSYLAAETTKVSSISTHNSFTINRQLVNAKGYHDKFRHISLPRPVQEALYQSSMKILEHRNATQLEDLYALDARTGIVITQNCDQVTPFHTGFNSIQYKNILDHGSKIILLHNHPSSTRPSITDINTLANEPTIACSIVIGHDASVQVISIPVRGPKVDTIFNFWYTAGKAAGWPNQEAKLRATDYVYAKGAVRYEKY